MAASEVEPHFSHPTEIAAQRFALARKGYAPEEVHRFLRQVAEQVSRLQGEIEWQRARGEHLERRTTAAQEAAYARLSRDFMDVVRRADEAAGRVRAEAEAQARADVGAAHREAARLLAAAAEQAEMILTASRAEAERMLREGRAGGSNGAGAAPDPYRPPVREPDAKPAPPAGRPAQPDVGDLDLDLGVSMFDLFDDLR